MERQGDTVKLVRDAYDLDGRFSLLMSRRLQERRLQFFFPFRSTQVIAQNFHYQITRHV